MLSEKLGKELQTRMNFIFNLITKPGIVLTAESFKQPFGMLAGSVESAVKEGVELPFKPADVKNIPMSVAGTMPSAYSRGNLLKAAFECALRDLGGFFDEFLDNPQTPPATANIESSADVDDDNGASKNEATANNEGVNSTGDGEDPTTASGKKIVRCLRKLYGINTTPVFDYATGKGCYHFRTNYFEEINAEGAPEVSNFRAVMLLDGQPRERLNELVDTGKQLFTLLKNAGLNMRPKNWNDDDKTYALTFELPFYWDPEEGKIKFEPVRLID